MSLIRAALLSLLIAFTPVLPALAQDTLKPVKLITASTGGAR